MSVPASIFGENSTSSSRSGRWLRSWSINVKNAHPTFMQLGLRAVVKRAMVLQCCLYQVVVGWKSLMVIKQSPNIMHGQDLGIMNRSNGGFSWIVLSAFWFSLIVHGVNEFACFRSNVIGLAIGSTIDGSIIIGSSSDGTNILVTSIMASSDRRLTASTANKLQRRFPCNPQKRPSKSRNRYQCDCWISLANMLQALYISLETIYSKFEVKNVYHLDEPNNWTCQTYISLSDIFGIIPHATFTSIRL